MAMGWLISIHVSGINWLSSYWKINGKLISLEDAFKWRHVSLIWKYFPPKIMSGCMCPLARFRGQLFAKLRHMFFQAICFVFSLSGRKKVPRCIAVDVAVTMFNKPDMSKKCRTKIALGFIDFAGEIIELLCHWLFLLLVNFIQSCVCLL